LWLKQELERGFVLWLKRELVFLPLPFVVSVFSLGCGMTVGSRC
jgi:hypothetical protein